MHTHPADGAGGGISLCVRKGFIILFFFLQKYLFNYYQTTFIALYRLNGTTTSNCKCK